MCGVPLAQASGLLTALKILGPWHWLRFGVRAVRLLLPTAIAKWRSGKSFMKREKAD
jgi:hypothetical protein